MFRGRGGWPISFGFPRDGPRIAAWSSGLTLHPLPIQIPGRRSTTHSIGGYVAGYAESPDFCIQHWILRRSPEEPANTDTPA